MFQSPYPPRWPADETRLDYTFQFQVPPPGAVVEQEFEYAPRPELDPDHTIKQMRKIALVWAWLAVMLTGVLVTTLDMFALFLILRSWIRG